MVTARTLGRIASVNESSKGKLKCVLDQGRRRLFMAVCIKDNIIRARSADHGGDG